MNKKPFVRTEYIGIRVTPEEKAALVELASAADMSLTSFLLSCSLGVEAAEDCEREEYERYLDKAFSKVLPLEQYEKEP